MNKAIIVVSLITCLISAGIFSWKALGYLVYKYPAQKGDYVLLVHGLWNSPVSMVKIGNRLMNENYNVINVGYPSTEREVKAISRGYLKEVIKKNCPNKTKKIHFVTHSMGGIIVRDYINDSENISRFGKVIMLAPPNNGSEIIDNVKGIKVIEKILGPAGMALGTGEKDIPKTLGEAKVPTGVVIGTGKLFPFLSLFVDEENDGCVTIESAKLEGMKDFKVEKSSHTMITFDDQVIEYVVNFLKLEKFS